MKISAFKLLGRDTIYPTKKRKVVFEEGSTADRNQTLECYPVQF